MNSQYNIIDWSKYFQDIGLLKRLQNSHLKYIKRMIDAGLPVIFEFRHLASLLGRTPFYLASVVNSTENHYREFKIPKRRGGERVINAPYPALLECQQWINKNILVDFPLHKAATGFKKKSSIKDNAKRHLNKACLLKMDLADFFPSISKHRIIKLFRNFGYPKNISFYLASICCLSGHLPQGAATSPALSNIVANKLDKRLSNLTKKWKLNYTRYADDLTFSGQKIPIIFSTIVSKIVRDEGFEINNHKTILCRSKGKRIVTGLSVNSKELKLPREYKRKLRQEVHHILKHGYFSHTAKLKIRDPFYIDSIYGKLLFWNWIEPKNSFVNNTLNKILHLKNKMAGME